MANFHLISELLDKRKITQKDFCEQIQISTTAFRQLVERNSTKTEIIERIARELRVPVGYFFGDNNSITMSGQNTQVHNGNGHQIMLSAEQKEIELLRQIITEKDKQLEDKERFIRVLLERNK
ncbi:MAG: helix-turn-helix domain-containing protein [Macellibacteroides fermentans]|uniref:helix-turn-helix domain-containing protein n=1 Tax=Macellibacteroides fermentans TaxID=879969 RepID=UPI003B720D13|nr:helix-turn-helix transcriptional regulator [Porphyromonadaceae bacterium]